MCRLLQFIFAIFFFLNCASGQTVTPKKLIKLVRKGKLEKVKIIIDKDSSLLNIRTRLNGNLLTEALWEGKIEIAKYLIEKNINVNVQENRMAKYSPLLISTSYRQYEITYLLVKKGANLNCEATHGSTPLRNAMQLSKKEDERDLEVFKFLVKSGADFKCVCGDCCQSNYLMHAIINNKTSFAKYLIELGIDLNQLNCHKGTVLHLAAMYNNIEIVKILLEKGLDPNSKDEEEKTAIDWAKSNKNEELLKLLNK